MPPSSKTRPSPIRNIAGRNRAFALNRGNRLLALLASLKEGGKGDVEPPQYCGREYLADCSPASRTAFNSSDHRIADAAAPVSLNALLRPGVIKIAQCAKHCVTVWPCARPGSMKFF
jgi:hypothetical protein